ncbi:YbdD/YjiX family protein [Lysobacter cavernae]|uniref:YbdD/YjiX family protein n=1 Tax=Lysobacter cavernae TaxID=1685901 RepID=A0ABV7RLY2_9GAMM
MVTAGTTTRVVRVVVGLLATWWRASARTARLAIGIPDYDNYAEHIRRNHPERTPMTRDEFFRERMDARYGKGRSRCC